MMKEMSSGGMNGGHKPNNNLGMDGVDISEGGGVMVFRPTAILPPSKKSIE